MEIIFIIIAGNMLSRTSIAESVAQPLFSEHMPKMNSESTYARDNLAGPLVSIIIPTFDRAKLFQETLDSVAAQTYENWECIVVDDGSTDGTGDLVRCYCSDDPRFMWVPRPSNKPRGASSCRNHGLARSSGEYLIFLDSDDLLAPTCLERRVEVMCENPETDFAVFPTQMFERLPGDSNTFWNAFTNQNDLVRFLKVDPPWQTAGPIWRKQAVEQVGGWREGVLSWQDWEFHLRALAKGLTFVKIPEPDSFYRKTQEGSISFSSNKPRYGANRRRVLPNILLEVTGLLRANNELTSLRRKLLGAHFYRLAFKSGGSAKKTVVIWQKARISGAVSRIEFVTVLICWRMMGRVSTRLLNWFFPELGLLYSSDTLRKVTVPAI